MARLVPLVTSEQVKLFRVTPCILIGLQESVVVVMAVGKLPAEHDP